jgi:hypothetical protein
LHSLTGLKVTYVTSRVGVFGTMFAFRNKGSISNFHKMIEDYHGLGYEVITSYKCSIGQMYTLIMEYSDLRDMPNFELIFKI